MAWFCLHDGTVSDPKWIVIARRSGQPKAVVLSIWIALLEHANQQDNRGSLQGLDCEVLDALFDLEPGASEAVLLAMADKGLIAGDMIANWEKRQFKPECRAERKTSLSSTERSRQSRERRRAAACNVSATNATACNDLQRDATQCNAVQRFATALKDINNIKKQDIKTPPLPPTGGSGGEPPASQTQSPPERQLPSSQSGWSRPEPKPTRPGRVHADADMEFECLRAMWNEHVIAEADLDGHVAFLALKKNRTWPGLHAIENDVARRKASGFWKPGYEPGLDSYLRKHGWTAPAESPRAAQQAANVKSFAELQEEREEARWQARLAQSAEYDRRKAEEAACNA